MLKRLVEQDDGKQEWRTNVKSVLNTMQDAIGAILSAVSGEEDLDDARIDSKEDIINGLKKQVAGALDIILAGVDEILDLFEYEQGDDDVGDNTFSGDNEGEGDGEDEDEDGDDESDPDEEELNDELPEEKRSNRFLLRKKRIRD